MITQEMRNKVKQLRKEFRDYLNHWFNEHLKGKLTMDDFLKLEEIARNDLEHKIYKETGYYSVSFRC